MEACRKKNYRLKADFHSIKLSKQTKLHNKMLVTEKILTKFRATFSHVNKRFPIQSGNSTEWKSALTDGPHQN